MIERIDHQETYSEVLGRNTLSDTRRLLRIYSVPPLATEEQRRRVEERARWEAQVLGRLGRCPSILTADSPFTDEAGIVIPFEHFQGITLATAKDFFTAVVGDVFGRQRRERRRGRDIRYTLTVELAQAVAGGEHEIGFEASGACSTCTGTGTRPGGRPPTTCPLCQGRGEVKGDGFLSRYTACGRCGGVGMIQRDPCQACSGRGSRREKRSFHVKLPPGTESGAERVVDGQGEPGQFGGPPGHLRLTINVRPHPWLRREGHDIVGELYVSVTEAARGGRVPVPILSGTAMVEIPAGVSNGAKLRLRGKGVPGEVGRPGDQIISVVVETPKITSPSGAPATNLAAALDALERAVEADPQLLPRRAAQRGG